jgi:hypothetical protein
MKNWKYHEIEHGASSYTRWAIPTVYPPFTSIFIAQLHLTDILSYPSFWIYAF